MSKEEEKKEKPMEFSEEKYEALIAMKGFELSKRYYIHFTGAESLQDINKKMAMCTRNLQEIDWVLGELVNAETFAKDALKAAEQNVDMKSSGHFIQIVNDSQAGGKRATDAYASAKVKDATKDSDQFKELTNARADYLICKSRLLRWERLHSQIDFIYEALKSAGIHYMSESKITRDGHGGGYSK